MSPTLHRSKAHGLSAERLALVKRYADSLWRDPPDFKLAPVWALRPWIEDEDGEVAALL